MIIQRLSKGIKDQDWFVVMVEVMIVVVGIFIGLQVDDWNEARKETNAIQASIDHLKDDFSVIETETNTRVENHISIYENLQYLHRVINDPTLTDLDNRRLSLAIDMADFSHGNPKKSATYESLVASDKLRLLPSEELRLTLMEYHRGLIEASEAYLDIRFPLTEYTKDFKRHSVVKADMNIRELMANIEKGLGVASFDLSAMRADPNFIKALDQMIRMQFYMVLNHHNNHKNAQLVIHHLTSAYKD